MFSALLTWKYDEDENSNDNVDLSNVRNAVTEDALAKKRRLQNELTHALGVLGVKHSTFHSMLKRGELAEVRQMLKVHLKERGDALTRRDKYGIIDDDEFNIYLEDADMTTIHESYQFLIVKYLDKGEDMMAGHFLDSSKLKQSNSRRNSNTCLDPNDEEARYIKTWEMLSYLKTRHVRNIEF